MPDSVAGRPDRADPAVRATLALRRACSRERTRRLAAATLLGVLAVLAPLLAVPLTGDPGAMVGAVVGAVLLVGLAVAVWPHEAMPDEQRHRELEAIWREARPAAGPEVPWERFAAWAETAGAGRVELVLLRCAPAGAAVASPYTRESVRVIDADDVGAAAEAMEELRARAASRERAARAALERETAAAGRREHEHALVEIDRAAAAELRERDEFMRREAAAQALQEREEQARAVARALRRH